MTEWNRESFLNCLSALNVFKGKKGAAPHKPLLVLLALSKLARGEPRLMPYHTGTRLRGVKEELGALLKTYNPTGKVSPHYPFWRLMNERLSMWEVVGDDRITAAREGGVKELSDGELVKGGAKGGFKAELFAFLLESPGVVSEGVNLLLANHFSPTAFEDLRSDLCLPYVFDDAYENHRRRKRDPRFRFAVLEAYRETCAFCEYRGKQDTLSLGVEAAHIEAVRFGGLDIVPNGLALCAIHHKVFDTPKALAIGDDFKLIVGKGVHWSSKIGKALLDLDARPILRPDDERHHPSLDFIRRHRELTFGS